MTEAELKHLEDRCLDETELRARDEAIDDLVAEVRRLQWLIKRGEWVLVNWASVCVWCHAKKESSPEGKHDPECPAFTEDGEVR